MTDATLQNTEAKPRYRRSEPSRIRDNQRRLKALRAEYAVEPWKALFKVAKKRARVKGVPFLLTPEWAKARWTGACEVTGIKFQLQAASYGCGFSPSIDRIVPLLGYVPGNCRFVLFAVNVLKGLGTDETMREIAAAIVASGE